MLQIINPANESTIASIEAATAEDVNRAVQRAKRAQERWAREAPAARAMALRRFADVVDGAKEQLAELEVSNAGHTIGAAVGGAENVRDVLEYSAGGVERLLGDQVPVAGGINISLHEPIGVVAVIVPWNFPMVIAGWSIGPALAAGNAVIVKPAELTPLSALRLERLALEAGLPEGVLQVVPGKGSVVGEALVKHADVGHVVFTGSTEVGKKIMAQASEHLAGVTLELGGKSANIVFDDADMDDVIAGIPGACFDNAGQDCCARSRILVQRSAIDVFLERLEPVVTSLRVGDPADVATDVGPLISAGHLTRVGSFLEDVSPTFQAAVPSGAGFWMPPTVVRLDGTDSRLWREEIFGPIVAVVPFDDERDAVRLANDTQYGLSGSVWSSNLGRALRTAQGVRSGNLSINSNSSVRYSTPFGGMKQSGIGRELGPHSLAHFSETKNIFINTLA